MAGTVIKPMVSFVDGCVRQMEWGVSGCGGVSHGCVVTVVTAEATAALVRL